MEEKIVVETPTKKGKFIFYSILFLVYLTGMGIILINKPKEKTVESFDKTPITVTPEISKTEYKINPPTLALTGSLKIVSKTIEKMPRFSEDWEELATASNILQEEKIRTDTKGKAEIIFPDYLALTINPDSEINFTNLIPASFIIEQSLGLISYAVEKPISVKSIDTLTLLQPGRATLEIDPDNGFIYLNIASGSAKFSFIDNDNQTQVYEIEKGDRVTYNPENTSIVIR